MSTEIHNRIEEVNESQDHIDDDLKALKQDQSFLRNECGNNSTFITPVSALSTPFSNLSTQTSTASNASDGSLCCDICNIRVTSAKILQRHLEGRKHKSRSERRGKTFHCDLCDVTANSEIQLNIHLASSKHKSRVAREEYKEFFDVSSYSKGIYVLLFALFCIIVNLVILVKVGL